MTFIYLFSYMRLKSLEIRGFKSFANKTIIHFNEPMIGIVGPNGSGKSNIVDSIRWVLGEQKSKELRLESMGDVIFNGTKNKKKGGMAQVTLSFENTRNILPTEYQEVAISRILYRSGESEYRLNDVKCRLKDITNLFMDSGIGSNSYAIIELGMVDDILADKDNARRKMFEQAAGISKFKIRKRETINKLKLTEADLDRVEDLLFELETNMKGLEKQAKRTERYYKLKDKYKQIHVHSSKLKLEKLGTQLTDLKAKIATEKDRSIKLKTDLRNFEAALEAGQKESIELEQKLSANQKETNQLFESIRDLENQTKIQAQKIDFFKQNQQKLTLSIEKSLEDEGRYNDRIKELNNTLKVHLAEEEKCQKMQIAALEKLNKYQLEFQSLDTNAKSQSQAFEQIQEEKYRLEKDIAIKENTVSNVKQQLKGFQLQIDEISTSKKSKQSILKDLQSQQKDTQSQVDKILKQLGKEKELLDKNEARRSTLKTELDTEKRALDKNRNEFNLLKSMVDSMEGFPASVKFLYDHYKGKIPMLSDAFDCPPAYRDAIEKYIEPYINHFIVETDAQAFEAIDLLKSAQKGRAKFLVLSRVKESKAKTTAQKDMVAAMEVISCQEKHKALLAQLFSNVYIAENYKGQQIGAKIINKEGTWIIDDFTISGGSKGLFEGKKLGRKKALESLTKTISKNESNIGKKTKELEELEAKIANNPSIALDEERRKIEVEIQRFGFQITNLEQSIQQINQTETNNLSLKNERLNTIKETEASIKEAKARLLSIDKEFVNKEAALKEHSSTLGAAQIKLNELQQNYNTHNLGLVKAQNEANITRTEIRNIEENLMRMRQSTENDKLQIERIVKSLAEMAASSGDYENKLKTLLQNKTDKAVLLNSAEEAFFSKKSELHEFEKNIRITNQNLMNQQSLQNQLNEKVHTYQFEEKEIYNRLQIEFEIDRAGITAFELPEDLKELEDLELEVEKLKHRLANYGDINPMAITAYEEIKERYDYIVKQRDDILYAQEDLQKTISEIESTATEKYMEAFSSVKENFQVTFRSLFTEDDDCDLILLDEENPLESKIEIIAKPKGKRPKSLSQLSGGEKTLTATALLFSLYLLKPAPFCILDEVDAPLDDRNVAKFTNLIRTFSDNSQFIIITHNKATMKEVDVLYGVYMQEIGVSEMSAVDFRDKQDIKKYEAIVN